MGLVILALLADLTDFVWRGVCIDMMGLGIAASRLLGDGLKLRWRMCGSATRCTEARYATRDAALCGVFHGGDFRMG